MRAVRAFAILLLLSNTSMAGPNRWTTSGPLAGAISRVYVSPIDANTAFAATVAGLYRTSDGGRSWHPAANTLPDPDITAFVETPDGKLFVASSGGVFMSVSSEPWAERANPGAAFIYDMAFDAKTKRLLLASDAPSGIFTSSDDGATWKAARITDSLPGKLRGVRSVAVSATAAYAVAVTTNTSVVLRSTDGGQTWTAPAAPTGVIEIFADPSSASVYGARTGYPLLVSKDAALTWTSLPLPPEQIFGAAPRGSEVFVALSDGVYVYEDGATAAERLGDVPVHDLAVSSSTPHRLYGAPSSGIVTFADGDRDWVANNAGLPGALVQDVDLSAIQPSTAYATTFDGVFRTDDGGQNWIRLDHLVSPSGQVAVSPATPNTAYLFGSDNTTEGALGAYKTEDAGATWKGVYPNFVSALAIAPSDPKTLYATLSAQVSRSSDGGQTWKNIGSDFALSPLELYYGVFYLSSLTIDPSSSSHVFVCRDPGIFETTDGAHWKHISSQKNVRALTIDSTNSSTLYGAAATLGFIKSTDGGSSWNVAGLADKVVLTIAQAASTLFAGTSDGHIYRSDDGGNSWTGFDDGTSFGRVNRIVVDPARTRLYAATLQGVYSYDIVDQNIEVQRIDNNLDRIRSAALMIPVAGTLRGANGTLYTTQLTLTNPLQSPQTVFMTRLPRPGEPDVADSEITTFTVTIPAASSLKIIDVTEQLGAPGVGSMVINADPSITASTIIWSYPTGGLAPVSQMIPSAPSGSFAPHAHARASGMEQDAQFRSNAGIVNLSGDAHQFTIQVTGERGSNQFTIEVAPYSFVQAPLPEGDYGKVTIDAFADGADVPWLLFSSSINNATGQAQTVVGATVN